ncbi:MAG: hypothetical protein H6564_04090 [Lewinellaceae bacterium]|nr:hypothetical protein [Lewinellaceae bacterium]
MQYFREVWFKGVALLLCLLIFPFLVPTVLTAQSKVLPVEYYSVNDGLSDRFVSSIIQAGPGLIWLGTQNGLNRFDGYEFIAFNNHPNNRRQISDSNIRNLALDKHGNIVITFRSNYGLFDILNPETLEHQTVSLFPEYGINGLPRLITVNAKGDILIVAIAEKATHIYRYLKDNEFELVVSINEEHKEKSVVMHLLELDNGQFLINDSEMGLRLFAPDGKLLRLYNSADFECLDYTDTYPGSAYFMHQDGSGRIWFSLQGQHGVFCFTAGQPNIELYAQLPKDSYFTNIWEDQKGNVLLAGSRRPKDIYPLQNLSCIKADGQMLDFSYLLDFSRYIIKVYSQDFFQTLFLGIDTGLKIVQNRQSKVRSYLAEDLSQDRRGAVMRGIDSDGKRFIYFAREVDEWYELDLQTGFLDTLQLIDEHTGKQINLSCLNALRMDREGNLWGTSCQGIASIGGQLHKYNTKTCLLKSYDFESRFSALALSKDGTVWLCAEPTDAGGQLVSFDPKTEQFSVYYDKEGNNPLQNASPYFVMQDSKGLLWAGTENGLYQIDLKKGYTRSYKARKGVNSLSSNIIYTIHEDDKGQIWLGTTNGLDILDPVIGLFTHYDRNDGLASNTVCGIVPAENGNYWISTYNGLSYFDRERNLFRNFYTTDGLSHDEFNRFSYARGPDGRFYFGGVNGINAFYSKDLLVDSEPPPVALTKITRYNSRLDSTIVQDGGLTELKGLKIYPSDSYFTIHYTLPNYKSPRRNQYRTWLEGYDKTWTNPTSTPSVRFNKLPPRNYILHVKGADANGNWNTETLKLSITVKPAFRQTAWFYVLLILGIASIGYIIFKNRLERRLEMERIRTKLSSDLHDEVSGLLSGIALQSDLLQGSVKDEPSLERLRNIGEVSRRAMSKMSDVIWSIDSRKDKVEDLIHRMREHAEEMLSPLSIAFEIHIGRMDRLKKMPVQLRQNLYFIFKEAINNIAKHSRATRATIRFYNDGTQYFLTVQDNGKAAVGSKPKVNGKSGQGLSNLRMRAQRIDAEIDIHQHDNGFKVTVKGKRFC